MTFDAILTLLLVLTLVAAAFGQYFGFSRRTYRQVAHDLFLGDQVERIAKINDNSFDFSSEAVALGIFDRSQRVAFLRKLSVFPWLGALIGVAMRFVAFPAQAPASVAFALAIVGLAGGYLVGQSVRHGRSNAWQRSCQFCLPLTMERLVMGVQAGLDLLSALNVILKDESDCPTNDPILELMRVVMNLTESGMPFEQALKEVGANIQLTAIKHAFTHLAIAHREGGELVMPLKELSDATQSFYQETVEEEIAKLPVRATLPLLCTFAGLIIFFITSPLIQVISMTSGVAGGLK